MNYENAYKLLEEKGQLHLLKYYDTLSEAEQAARSVKLISHLSI